MNNQKHVFLKTEADKWFERNKGHILESKVRSYPFDSIFEILNKLKSASVLEIGSSVGHNLDYIRKNSNSDLNLFAIEPSLKAIEHGKALYEDIKFYQGTADDLRVIEDDSIDIVIIGFCMYLVDRELLSLVVSEVDKKVKAGGKVIIFDFDSKYPIANEYKHHEGILSYKMDYSQLFTAMPNYFLVEKKSWSHITNEFTEDKNERCASWLLHKEIM